MRAVLVAVLVSLTTACTGENGPPELSEGDSSNDATAESAVDTSMGDTTTPVDSTADSSEDSTVDTSIADTSIADTSIADTSIADTSADTEVADTSVADSALDTSVADSADGSDVSDADTTVIADGDVDAADALDSAADTLEAATDTADAADTPDTRAEPPIVHAVSGVNVDTLAGSSTQGSMEGTGAGAQFDNPAGIALEAAGTLLVTEYDGGRVRRITAGGTTSLVASGLHLPFGVTTTSAAIYFQTDADKTGVKSATTGTIWKIVGAAAPVDIVTGLGRPRGIVGLSDGRVILSDRRVQTVSVLDPAAAPVTVTLIAGSGTAGFANGTGSSAQFNSPYGVARLPDGSFVVVDSNNHCIRQVTMAGAVTVFAGDRNPGMKDDADKMVARFDSPSAIATDAAGNVYVSDFGNHRIRRISPSGAVETLAGDGVMGFAEGAGTSAELYGQEGLASTADGKTVYFTDGNSGDGSAHHRVRRITIP